MEIFNVKLNDTSIRIIFCKTLSAFRTENTIVMLKGKAVSNGKPVSTEEIARVVEEKGVSEVIENLDGVFCILIYHFNDLLIGKSIQSGPALFYCKKNMDIFVSDKISDIKFLNPDMTFSLNIKMAEHYLSGNRIATQESLITGIYKVNNGEFIKFNNQLKPVLLRDEFSITKKNNSTIDSIIDNIEMMRDNRKIALLFSGGLDSALIFHTLKESGNKFCAYHFFSDESDDSEKYFAKEYCS
ncbi:TPA: lasso peptide isopeptide bond-forming cyclase, partial [Escherichia coli]|nr:lasso peptide isopeptide bond-forming cyclase [Escherichia coli]HBP3700652.1 lasso peptide isopeptide bond-forming cyclase [Escherichia coli]HCQ8795317.1 lasso peptide isopeptide bond-forming cyclase [Escherichia coli]